MRTKIIIPIDPDIEATDLTFRQKQILQVIREFIQERGYPPTVRETGEKIGLASSASIHAHMSALADAGYINRDQTKPRALEITMKDSPNVSLSKRYIVNTSDTVSIPLLGKVTAGLPILASENIEEYYSMPKNILGTRDTQDLFMLNVVGDSMQNAGILDGDFIIVKKQQIAQNGDIVVALVDEDEATVKRFFKNAKKIVLMPENDNYSPIEGTNIAVLGKVVSVFRNL